MVVCRPPFFAGDLYFPEHQKAQGCREDGGAVDVEADDARIVIETLLLEVLAVFCCFMLRHCDGFSPLVRNESGDGGKGGCY